MVRIGAIFIVLCMALIAGSLAFVLYFRFGLGAAESGLVGLGALTALALYSGVSGRKQDRTEVSDQVAARLTGGRQQPGKSAAARQALLRRPGAGGFGPGYDGAWHRRAHR